MWEDCLCQVGDILKDGHRSRWKWDKNWEGEGKDESKQNSEWMVKLFLSGEATKKVGWFGKSQEWWSISSPEVARREERSKEVKDAEARPVSWRRGADWTPVLHITSASPSKVNLVMVDISIAIKLRNIQKCDETRSAYIAISTSIFSFTGHIWTPKCGSEFFGWDFVPNLTRFLWWFSQCNEAQPVSHLFRSSFFSLTKTFLVNCNMSFHDAALQLVVKGFQLILESVSWSYRNSLESPFQAFIFPKISPICLLGRYFPLPSQRPEASPMLTSLKG